MPDPVPDPEQIERAGLETAREAAAGAARDVLDAVGGGLETARAAVGDALAGVADVARDAIPLAVDAGVGVVF